ncbi:MAG: tetratricopeptide repeat protein [Candidatus Krumholzibacteria bacterium]|nr:tetratricopeptide repeat protein [Candidatus Krumholzibacteria bacterium]MDH4335894.1 tetratricopeptide repeat protein [Candidatus Krumholzibacteria bacterium]MDH5268530.1 tetratricopeptide repeat protein [Candidatus Krumholzibacteria bacterium]
MRAFARVSALTAALCLAAWAGSATAQEVLDKTKDEHGFERQLTTVDMMHQTASQLMTAKQFDKAAEELEKVVQQEPARIAAWQDLGACYRELKNYPRAAEAYAAAHKLEPQRLDLLSNLGHTQILAAEQAAKADQNDAADAQYAGAVVSYDAMLAIDPASYDAAVHLGFLYQKQGKLDKAAEFYEMAVTSNPEDAQSLGSLAQIYAEQKDSAKAIDTFERAIAATTGDTRVRFQSQLGKILINEQQFEKSAAVYTELVAEKPDNASYQYNLGASLKAQKKFKEATPYLEKAIEIKPDFALAYQELAACYNEQGRYGDAINMSKKGLEHTDKKAGLYVAWGEALEKVGSYDEAISVFQRATGDPQWGAYAKAKITRQENLKKRQQAAAGQ